MSALGYCTQCHGDLCVAGGVIRCEKCGTPQPSHPRAGELAPTGAAATPGRAFEHAPMEYVASWGDRIAALEKRAAAQDAEIERLKKLAGGKGGGGKGGGSS